VNPVRFRRSAQQDIQKAFDYFEAQSAGLGAEFLERVEDVADRISSNPYTYQTVFHDLRRADLRKFRYGLFYRVEDEGSVVVACLAHRQDLVLARKRARSLEP